MAVGTLESELPPLQIGSQLEHLLCGCLTWAELRRRVFGSPHLEVEKLREMDLGDLIFLAEIIDRRLA